MKSPPPSAHNPLFLVFALLLSTLFSAAAVEGQQSVCPGASSIEISQGRQIITNIQAVTTDQSVVDFYNYGGGVEKSSFGGDLELFMQNLLVLIHQNEQTCDSSLVFIADKPLDNSGGRAGVLLSPGDFTTPSVEDDANMGFQYNREKDTTWVQFRWNECCTDGFAHPLDISTPGCMTIDLDVVSGINTWMFRGGNGIVGLQLDQELRLCFGGASLCKDQRICQWWDLACRGEMFFGCRDMPILSGAFNSLTFDWSS